MEKKNRRRLRNDLIIVAVSVLVAWILVESSVIDRLLSLSSNFGHLRIFINGLFFTSAFTTIPSLVVFTKLSELYSPIYLALIGGLGALIGDLIIFLFIKDHILEDVNYLFSKSKSRRIHHLFEYRFMRWSMAFLGAIIIASPLPDELGLTFMGLSKISLSRFVLISYSLHSIGIFVVAVIARAV